MTGLKYHATPDRRAIVPGVTATEHALTAPEPDFPERGTGAEVGHGRTSAARFTGTRAITSLRLVAAPGAAASTAGPGTAARHHRNPSRPGPATGKQRHGGSIDSSSTGAWRPLRPPT